MQAARSALAGHSVWRSRHGLHTCHWGLTDINHGGVCVPALGEVIWTRITVEGAALLWPAVCFFVACSASALGAICWPAVGSSQAHICRSLSSKSSDSIRHLTVDCHLPVYCFMGQDSVCLISKYVLYRPF